MRIAASIVLVLLAVAWVLTEVPAARFPNEVSAAVPTWRRTADGWWRVETWEAAPEVAPVRLHPAVLAAFQLFVSLTALVAALPGNRAIP